MEAIARTIWPFQRFILFSSSFFSLFLVAGEISMYKKN